MNQSRRRPPSVGFECSETVEDGRAVKTVQFRCTVPNHSSYNYQSPLFFHCRDHSCGVLLQEEVKEGTNAATTKPCTDMKPEAQSDDCEDYAVDPNFFDPGYTLAGRTGFQVWAGSRLAVEALLWPQKDFDCERLKHLQQRISEGARVLELGSGIGVVGTNLANTGAEVLLTDLSTVVDNATYSNILLNKSDSPNYQERPAWLGRQCVRIGSGWAMTASVDWTRPLVEQLSACQREAIDVVIASDCVWLVSMLDALLNIVASVFDSSKQSRPSLLLSFQRRDAAGGDNSEIFATMNRVLAAVNDRQWSVDCLAWTQVEVGTDTSEVFLFEARPPTAEVGVISPVRS
jgi:Lysine methyltransferase